LLLDAATFIWIDRRPERLSASARAAYEDSANALFLSSISAYEIVVKAKLGRLDVGGSPVDFVARVRETYHIDSLDLTEESAFAVERLPPIHADPFDRLMIAQSIVHTMTILTPDATVARYPIRVLW